MRKIYFITLLLLLSSYIAQGQCNILSNAVAGIFLDYQSTALLNCSGVAYNPIQGKYYAVRAGNVAFPMETWSSTGTQLYSTTAGFDWRGMWWNPNLGQLEGNGFFNIGLWRANLDGSGNALPTGSMIFTGLAQPDAQSCGSYDPGANEVIYYFNGRIYRYSRATNAAISNYALVGCPVSFSNLNSTTVAYTGCPGKEIAVLDFILKRIYIFQKNTGIYQGMCQLPAAAVTSSQFRFSWANGYAWLFDLAAGNWYSYRVFDAILPENAFNAHTIWFAPSVAEVNWESGLYDQFQSFDVERSLDGMEFSNIGSRSANDFSAETDGLRQWSLQDAMVPSSPVIYYRVKLTTLAGETEYSDVMTLTRDAEEEFSIGAWPVPATDVINVRMQNAVVGSEMVVMDAAGKMVHQEILSDQTSTDGFLKIDCSNWADGMYLLRLNDLQGHQAVHRLVVQH